jgi:hypothetical protein
MCTLWNIKIQRYFVHCITRDEVSSITKGVINATMLSQATVVSNVTVAKVPSKLTVPTMCRNHC